MRILLYAYVIAAGALTAIEAGANAKLTASAGAPWWPAVIFAAVTLTLLGGVAILGGGPFPATKLAAVPWWAWSGGIISALYVVSMMVAPGVLGAGLFTGLTVTAAVMASVAIDHFGLVGFPVHLASLGRLAGAALMIGGLALVAAF